MYSQRLQVGIITTVASVALLAGAAFGQSAPGGSGAAGSPGPAPMSSGASAQPQKPAINPLTLEDVSKIKGTAVYDSADKKIGSISTILMKPESKTIDRFVIGEGGVLGVGSHYVAMPIDAFTWDAQKDGFRLAKTADDLKSMPEWKEQVAESPDSSRSGGGAMGAGGGPSSTTPQPGAGTAPSAPTR